MIRLTLFDGPGMPLRVLEMPGPALKPGEVLVRISMCTICGSDLHTHAGKRLESTPCILGHEAVGEIEDLNGPVHDGNGVSLQVGDRVVWSVAASCGSCYFCQIGLRQKCVQLKKYGHVRHEVMDGPRGGLASHIQLWPGTTLLACPRELPDAVVAPASCATATVAACIRKLDRHARVVLVMGAGMLGLTASAMLAARGLCPIVLDRDADRLSRARRFGAVAVISLPCSLEILQQQLQQWTEGRGADAVLELTGSVSVTELGLDALRIGGTLVLAGAVFPTPALTIQPETLIRRLISIHGIHNYSEDDLRDALQFLTVHGQQYPFAELVAEAFPIARVNDAFRVAQESHPVRVAVVHS